MKNLKKLVWLTAACITLLILLSLDASAQTKSGQLQNPSAKIIKCKNNDSDC